MTALGLILDTIAADGLTDIRASLVDGRDMADSARKTVRQREISRAVYSRAIDAVDDALNRTRNYKKVGVHIRHEEKTPLEVALGLLEIKQLRRIKMIVSRDADPMGLSKCAEDLINACTKEIIRRNKTAIETGEYFTPGYTEERPDEEDSIEDLLKLAQKYSAEI